MPITENGFEYTIPKEIYDSIPDEFWNNFRHELYMIGGLSLCEEAGYSALDDGGTGGWFTALYNACKSSNCLHVFDYYNSLEWYDSDIFDGIISEDMAKRNLVKIYSLSDMAEETVFKKEDIDFCVKCGKPFVKQEMIEDTECNGFYYCYKCSQSDNNRNEYYKTSNAEAQEYVDDKSTIL